MGWGTGGVGGLVPSYLWDISLQQNGKKKAQLVFPEAELIPQ